VPEVTESASGRDRAVGVVGAGTMGSGIAQVLAQAGFQVWIHDERPEAAARARDVIARSLGRFVDKGTLTVEDRDDTLRRIGHAAELRALADVAIVIEAIIEDRSAKQSLFRTLDRLTLPSTLLASNTSSIPIADLASATVHPDRVLGLHFMNPVPLIPLVEVVRAHQTSPETIRAATALVQALGKTPIESADVPGFIANRVLMPMINEAIYAVHEGVGTPDAVDAVMTLGMKHPLGPLALADLIGLDVCLAILRVLEHGLPSRHIVPCPLLEVMVTRGTLGRKSGQGFYVYPGGARK
jgi:3-hydroxybutyryl-CoA dehydrogenase